MKEARATKPSDQKKKNTKTKRKSFMIPFE